jgi:hypothetical protein
MITYLAPVAISSHEEDDSMPDIIAASITGVSEQMVDEQGEKTHLIGAQHAQNSDIDSELTSSTRGNGYTRFFCPE